MSSFWPETTEYLNVDLDKWYTYPKPRSLAEDRPYYEMKVASAKTTPSSMTSSSPILSFRESFVFCGEYCKVSAT